MTSLASKWLVLNRPQEAGFHSPCDRCRKITEMNKNNVSKDSSKIFYLYYPTEIPSGGQKSMFRHVDVLHSHGFQAFAVPAITRTLSHEIHRLKWFENQTPIISNDELQACYDPNCDFVVFPETLRGVITLFPGRNKIIYNQNVYLGAPNPDSKSTLPDAYNDPNLRAVLCVSEHNLNLLKSTYPAARYERVRYGIDPEKFRFKPIHRKKDHLAFIPKWASVPQLSVLINILKSRARSGMNQLQDATWHILGSKTHDETARILHECRVLIFTSVTEGLPILPLEAMMSGCLVLSFEGGPQDEYLTGPKFRYGDVLGMANYVEKIWEMDSRQLENLNQAAELGRQTSLKFSLQQEEDSIIDAWTRIFQSGPNSEKLPPLSIGPGWLEDLYKSVMDYELA